MFGKQAEAWKTALSHACYPKIRKRLRQVLRAEVSRTSRRAAAAAATDGTACRLGPGLRHGTPSERGRRMDAAARYLFLFFMLSRRRHRFGTMSAGVQSHQLRPRIPCAGSPAQRCSGKGASAGPRNRSVLNAGSSRRVPSVRGGEIPPPPYIGPGSPWWVGHSDIV